MEQFDVEAFARIAVDLSEQPSVQDTVDLVLEYALAVVQADSASLMLLHDHGRRIEIAGATADDATHADRLQVETGQGPCIDAARASGTGDAGELIPDTTADRRWPKWTARLAEELKIPSVISVQLGLPHTRVGALNLYADGPDRFVPDDLPVAQVMARHAAIALARSRSETNLWQAIDAHKAIGVAQGVLMERFALDEDRAFAVLRRYSQDYNIKLHEVASRLLDTGELSGKGETSSEKLPGTPVPKKAPQLEPSGQDRPDAPVPSGDPGS